MKDFRILTQFVRKRDGEPISRPSQQLFFLVKTLSVVMSMQQEKVEETLGLGNLCSRNTP